MFSFVQVMVLFSETVQRAISQKLISVDMIDSYEPSLMFTIPRLAIITCVKPRSSLPYLLGFLRQYFRMVCSGLHVYPDGPLNPDRDPSKMCEMFRTFQILLHKIR